jgi:hypothetical protein
MKVPRSLSCMYIWKESIVRIFVVFRIFSTLVVKGHLCSLSVGDIVRKSWRGKDEISEHRTGGSVLMDDQKIRAFAWCNTWWWISMKELPLQHRGVHYPCADNRHGCGWKISTTCQMREGQHYWQGGIYSAESSYRNITRKR